MRVKTAHEQAKSEGGLVRLALATCGPQLEVALEVASSRVVSMVRLGGVTPRSTLVLAAVDLLVEDAGLRAGLATAAGIVAAVGAKCLAYDSLLMLAARCRDPDRVWCAQPGRRGEVYARRYEIVEGRTPAALGEIEILSISAVGERGPWIAAEALDLGEAARAVPVCSSAEALLHLAGQGAPADVPDPLYVEGPPVHPHDVKA